MKWYPTTKDHIDRGPATLYRAVEIAKKWNDYRLADDYRYDYLSNQLTMNCDGIQSKLIEYVGRWTESYGSDLIITLKNLDAFLGDDGTVDDAYGRWIIGVGIRQLGVDNNTFIISRLRETASPAGYIHPTEKYRKVLAIDIEDELKQDADGDYYRDRNIVLYDITNCLNRLAEEDK